MKRLLVFLVAFLLFFLAPAAAQEDEDRPLVEMTKASAGPIEFHVIPEIGAGILLRGDQTLTFDRSDGFFLVRIPGR